MVMCYNRFLKLTVTPLFPSFRADTGRKLNVHQTFRRRPRRLLYVSCTFNLRPMSTGSSVPSIIGLRRGFTNLGFFNSLHGVSNVRKVIYFSLYTADQRKVLNKLSGREHLMLRSLVTFSPTAFMNMCIIQFFNI